ncbi:hypothetical protein RJT34_11050 [Clitoria ternatea]|uniref:Maternal effect embryo arrest 22 n=1 Tax=Clitoria ternatea TaxID=43366 RepID=A0AAN9JLC1_CLITE
MALNPRSDSTNACCEQWKQKCLKARESRNALRQAVTILELRINEIQSQNKKAARGGNKESRQNLEELNGRVPVENETCNALPTTQQGCGGGGKDPVENENGLLADREKEISRLRELLEVEKRRADSERNRAAEACKLLEEEKSKTAEKGEIARIEVEKAQEYRIRIGQLEKQVNEAEVKLPSDGEKEINRLKELLEVEKRRADFERIKGDEARKLLEEEKNKTSEKGEMARVVSQKAQEYRIQIDQLEKQVNEAKGKLAVGGEKEINRLKDLVVVEKRRADSERIKGDEARKLLEEEKSKTSEKGEMARVEAQKAQEYRVQIGQLEKQVNEAKEKLASGGEKEISRLKDLVEVEKRRADSERTKADEARRLLREEKNKMAENGEIARTEARKAAEYMIQIGRLEKQVNDAKAKLTSEMSMFKEATKKLEAEKRKILADKRIAELAMTKANERLEVEKRKADEEKRRVDLEMAKLEEQKLLAEDNWNKFMKEKQLADQMSQQVEEDKRTIENLNQKILELSSLRKPIKMAADINVKAESTKVKDLKSKLKLQKLRAKLARQKYKLEASNSSILQHELGRIKTEFIQLLHRLDILDASFFPVAGSKHDHTKPENILGMQNSNVMRQARNLNLSQMHSKFENELQDPCCTTTNVCDPLRKNMKHTPPVALSCGNYSECITGIDSKLEPLVRVSNRTKLLSSAVNSSTESYSDGQLMGSQEATRPVTASANLTREIFNARRSMCNASDKTATIHHSKRKRMHDSVEYIANLSSEKLSDLHGLLYRKFGTCLGGRETLPNLNNLQEKNDLPRKKRKKSHREKAPMIPWINRDEKRSIEEANTEDPGDPHVCRHTTHPALCTLETTQACGEKICDAANNFDLVSFATLADGSYMKLLELENATKEECYRRAMDSPLSPLPEIELRETFDADNLMNPFLEEALQETMLSLKTDLFPSPHFDVINVEIKSNEEKFDGSGATCNSQNKSAQVGKSKVVKSPHMQTPEKLRAAFSAEDGIGSLHSHLPEFCVVFSNIKDNSIISRILVATKNCIARCNLATQTGWAVIDILTALKVEDKLSQKEKLSVLFTLLLFNFTVTTSKTFSKLWDGNLFQCLKSYSQHICTVLSNAETRILFVENYSLHELLGLIEDFLIEGKVIVNNRLDAESWSNCDLRASDFLDCASKVSSDVATNEQLVAGSIILASICAATDHVGFMCEASYDILRLCKWDSLIVLTILHIFAYLGGEKFFDLENFSLMVAVLKSLVMSLEGGSLSVATSCLPSISQLHIEFCMDVHCPFLEGAESIDAVACLLLEEINKSWLQGTKQVDLSDSRFMPDNYNAGQCFDQEVVECAINKNCDVPCLKKCAISATQSDDLKSIAFCHLSDVLSLVELVANKMSWQWTDIKLVPRLLNMLDSHVEGDFAIAIIVLLGQLGRIGVDVGGYEDQGVGKLRCNLIGYLCRTSSLKSVFSLQIATATALFGLLPLNVDTLLHTTINLPGYSKSVSDNAESMRKWFSGLESSLLWLLSGSSIIVSIFNYMLSFVTLMFTGHLGSLDLAVASIASVGIQGLAYVIMDVGLGRCTPKR